MQGIWTDPRQGRTSFREYADAVASDRTHLSPGWQQNLDGYLRNHILPVFGDMQIASIRPQHVRGRVPTLTAKDLAPATVGAIYRTFAKIMKTAEIDGLISRSPCIDVGLPRETAKQEMRFLSPAEVGRLAGAIAPRYRALIYTAAYTGLRWGELAALKIERLNLLRGTVDVVEAVAEVNGVLRSGSTKTGATRTVTLPRFLSDMLGEHIGLYPSRDDHVFSSAEGQPLRRRNFSRRHFGPAVVAAGLAPLRFHDLRHTCVAMLIAEGAHPKAIQARLGHSTIRLTFDRYGHLLPSLDAPLRDALDRAFTEAAQAASS